MLTCKKGRPLCTTYVNTTQCQKFKTAEMEDDASLTEV